MNDDNRKAMISFAKRWKRDYERWLITVTGDGRRHLQDFITSMEQVIKKWERELIPG